MGKAQAEAFGRIGHGRVGQGKSRQVDSLDHPCDPEYRVVSPQGRTCEDLALG